MPSPFRFHQTPTTTTTDITTHQKSHHPSPIPETIYTRHQHQINSLLQQPNPHPPSPIPETIYTRHNHRIGPNQCGSTVIQNISAPISTVWSLLRRYDNPQAYKPFLKSCQVLVGDGSEVGTLREVRVISGLPAAFSTERLEVLDDERYVLSFSVVGGEHRLRNYRSVTTLHRMEGNGSWSTSGTVAVESYVVDVPTGNTGEETCVFVDTIVRCNMKSLAQIAEKMASTEVL